MRPLDAQGLLTTAAKLASGTGGPGRPPLNDLRRATSTAYYALFHQITRHGALTAFPALTEEELALVVRWYGHTGVLKAANSVVLATKTKITPSKTEAPRVALLRSASPVPPSELVLVAETFIELQGLRHSADYDNSYIPKRLATLNHVDSANQAVKTTWSMWNSRSSRRPARVDLANAYERFLTLALMDSGGTRAR